MAETNHISSVRDSGVFLSDPTCSSTVSGTYLSSAFLPPVSTSGTHKISQVSRRPNSFRRPPDLNLRPPAQTTNAEPKSEVERRFDMMRDSQTQPRGCLKSPAQLLRDRLDLSPKKSTHESIRVFVPPRLLLGGCILPRPSGHMKSFRRGDICARTEGGSPSWWCALDQVVILDGVDDIDGEYPPFLTRSSKGLRVAKQNSDLERISIPLRCTHCWGMLGRKEWVYVVRVCKRSVCWYCEERCRWLMERETPRCEEQDVGKTSADSVFQEMIGEEDLKRNIGIGEQMSSPIQALGGFEEGQEPTK